MIQSLFDSLNIGDLITSPGIPADDFRRGSAGIIVGKESNYYVVFWLDLDLINHSVAIERMTEDLLKYLIDGSWTVVHI